MTVKRYIQKTTIILLSLLVVKVVSASFTSTGKGDSKDKVTSKYSLKTLGKYTVKPLSINYARYSYKLNASVINSNTTNNNNVSMNNIQMTNGNSTFIYPYKIKVKAPKFKTPSRSSF